MRKRNSLAAYEEHIPERVNNLILGNVSPPLFPKIQVCPSADGKLIFVVVRVHQSHTTPHAIRGNTQVYVRADTSNEPEELADLEKLRWLIDRKAKSQEMKGFFVERADHRFRKLCSKQNINLKRGDCILMACPVYPFESLVDPTKLRQDIPERIRSGGWGGATFPRLVHRVNFEAAQDGAYGFFVNENSGYVCYEELNQCGFVYYREDIVDTERQQDGTEIHKALLYRLMVLLDLGFESITKFYDALGYWGMVEFRIVLRNLDDVGFIDLPAPRNYIKIDLIVGPPSELSKRFAT
ncbi:MAG: hypothetical protein HY644_04280 [Acidobacteria bacterium]|nr:hypothetical protein [Acidobacteriota bacterium]